MSTRFRFCLFAWIAVVVATALSGNVQAQINELNPLPAPPAPLANTFVPEATPTPEWTISIVPAAKATSAVAAPEQSTAADYTRVYNSIPFNRAEYNINPTYRHDSAMEILTGNARHKTIVRHNSTPPVAARPVANAGNRYAVGNPYQYGYLRPALRLNYYRHFPSLNPYVNVWNYSGAY